MQQSPDFSFDVAAALNQGKRDYQEDAIITDFATDAGVGFVVLADGMGGHTAGDLASKIVVTEVFSELKLQSGQQDTFEKNVPDILTEAAKSANECVREHVRTDPATRGMGATLVAPVIIGNRLFWISVGDSPLYLFRDNELKQLNEDHSMAPQIDCMVKTGMMSEAEGKDHPDRQCLTSVLIGDDIPHIDCPREPTMLRDADILIVASDGLQFLDNDEIQSVLRADGSRSSTSIVALLLDRLKRLGDPEQDNISFSVIKVTDRRLTKPETQSLFPPQIFNGSKKDIKAEMAIAAPASVFAPAQFFRRSRENGGNSQ